MSKRKAPSGDGNHNSDFCDFLMELADYEKNVSGNIHKYNAYRKAAGVLASHNKRISSGEEARKLPGIGEKIAKKVDEFLETGKLRKLDNIHNDETSTAISLLTRVSGIGPAKAKELFNQGVKSIDDLHNMKVNLTHHQQIGLKYFDEFEQPIPRFEIKEIELKLKNIISNYINSKYNLTICGSYRRGKSTSGDIDVLVTHSEYTSTSTLSKSEKGFYLKKVVETLQSENIIVDTLSLGDFKFMGVCKLSENSVPRRLDIRCTPFDQYHCATLYFTGSDVFNKNMRSHAIEKGFTLNEYCLRPLGSTGIPGEPLIVTSEEDIFDYIDYPYKQPNERNA